MEYFTSISVLPQKEERYGLAVEDMIAPGMRLQYDGVVKGRFHYVPLYEGFSKSKENQSGYYLPLKINKTGEKLTIFKNGEKAKEVEGFGQDPYLVIKVEPGQIWSLNIDGREIASLDLGEAVFEEEKKERAMTVDFYDLANCGLTSVGTIAHFDKNVKAAETPIEIKTAIPKGTRLKKFITISSDDMEGPSSVGIGIHGTDPKEYGTATITQGQIVDTEVEGYKKVLGKTVCFKLDSDVTAGTVDVLAEVIRLEV